MGGDGSPYSFSAGSPGLDPLYPLKAAGRAFLFDEGHGVMLVGGIVHRHDQIPYLAHDPFVGAAVLMHHHAREGSGLAAFAVAYFAPS